MSKASGAGPNRSASRVDTVVKMAHNGKPAHDPVVVQFGIVNQALG